MPDARFLMSLGTLGVSEGSKRSLRNLSAASTARYRSSGSVIDPDSLQAASRLFLNMCILYGQTQQVSIPYSGAYSQNANVIKSMHVTVIWQ